MYTALKCVYNPYFLAGKDQPTIKIDANDILQIILFINNNFQAGFFEEFINEVNIKLYWVFFEYII